ncbi:class II fructose-bisphosphate aldolase [Buchnera aphidicola (Mollitrichosiphum nigrofasciatum)]|uniref:class II fructose-bisphosphate aldolase n=1 Tax=Buchnera aphidicola TaxID=9 RepID=UPI0031B87A77
MLKELNFIKPGVISGSEARKIFNFAKKNNFAIPAINCINTDSINTVLKTAYKCNSPVIIQLSYGGAKFFSGSSLYKIEKKNNAIIGAVAAAKYVHYISKYYKIPVILHTDHCDKKLLPWVKELIHIGTKFFKKNKFPLFSSHMIDLSKEPLKENITTCVKYLKKCSRINMLLEIELGCTGGEEDGIDNTNIKQEKLYTTPKDVKYAYKKLNKISKNFTIAAAFGNVHGVYKIGNIILKPEILKKSQKYIQKKYKLKNNPLNFVFHGGSGSSKKDIQNSIKYGVVKFNIDTDLQWSTWKGILKFYKSNKLFLQSQLGNPSGKNEPNKKFYDPRIWIQSAQNTAHKNLKKYFKKLNSYNIL